MKEEATIKTLINNMSGEKRNILNFTPLILNNIIINNNKSSSIMPGVQNKLKFEADSKNKF